MTPPGFPHHAQPLTPHEYRVAALVLEGRSNDESAHKLNVTRRTIEFHLTNIYCKLGVRRRTQLSSALAVRSHPENGRNADVASGRSSPR